MAEAEDILRLIDAAAKSSRDDLKEVIENHLDASERVIANLSAVTTIRDGSKLLSVAQIEELTKADPT